MAEFCVSLLAVDCVGRPVIAGPLAGMDGFLTDMRRQLMDPLFWFGLAAQGLFFARFIVQWMVSEKRKRSTVPTAFWYISLAGGISWCAYGVLRRDLAIMAGATLSCVIYTRNLMLIHGRAARRRRAGLPVIDADNGASPSAAD